MDVELGLFGMDVELVPNSFSCPLKEGPRSFLVEGYLLHQGFTGTAAMEGSCRHCRKEKIALQSLKGSLKQ